MKISFKDCLEKKKIFRFEAAKQLVDLELDPGEELKDIEIDKLYRVMLKASYGVLENLDAYVKLGVADVGGELNDYEYGVYQGKAEVNGKNAFAYGFGSQCKF